MDTSKALEWATLVIKWLPVAVQGVTEAAEFLNWGMDRMKTMIAESRDPTDEEWDELNSRTAALRTKLHSDDV